MTRRFCDFCKKEVRDLKPIPVVLQIGRADEYDLSEGGEVCQSCAQILAAEISETVEDVKSKIRVPSPADDLERAVGVFEKADLSMWSVENLTSAVRDAVEKLRSKEVA
jgi:hypothetical protein